MQIEEILKLLILWTCVKTKLFFLDKTRYVYDIYHVI